ncbi:hypothetical protein NP233_g10482 [Leucocoprinus birnbaumii]|uniref:Uncharacterized protein n=1 Tax=Leucocoprinus birnbaumii TaxID=56174 RepID=A0AAD5YL97_9AGAR|nr:hypothetical protein NP233_g10482 [Leucocoprinus birnbaumii]
MMPGIGKAIGDFFGVSKEAVQLQAHLDELEEENKKLILERSDIDENHIAPLQKENEALTARKDELIKQNDMLQRQSDRVFKEHQSVLSLYSAHLQAMQSSATPPPPAQSPSW